MANLIQALVYQIDGNPLPSPITLDFQVSDILVREASINIPAVNSAIQVYNVPNNGIGFKTYYAAESVSSLTALANTGSTALTQATVLEVGNDPQAPGGFQYSFPSQEIVIAETINLTTGVNATITYKAVNYGVAETQAYLYTNSNISGFVLNEQGVPAFYADTLTNIPAPGEVGRMFVSTDTFALYRDTGSSWNLIGGPGIGTVTGSGTTNYLSKWTSSSVLGNSLVFDNGTNVGIGTASPAYKLDVSGDIRAESIVAGVFDGLRLRNPSTNTGNQTRIKFDNENTVTTTSGGVIFFTGNAYSGFPQNSFGIWNYNSNGIIALATNATERMRVFANGNIGVNTTTDAGYKLDVNGTARINGVLTFGTTPTLESFNGNTMLKLTASLGLTISSDRWNSNTSSSSYIQNGYTTKNFITTNAANGTFNSFDFSASNAYQPTIANLYTQKLINGAMTINSTAATNNFHGVSISTTDNSASIANNVFAVYADATLGTNTSANRWAGYFVGRGYFSDVVGIGTTSPSASSILHLSSTTKGFLPPVMTGANAEAIATPAAGLLVYANNGNGVTITSIGWWGYNGTTWVKLN